MASSSETIENGFTLALELEDTKEDDFLNKYINPILNFSFDFEQKSKIRTTNTNEAMEQIRELVTPLTQKDNVVEFNVVTSRIGIVKTDVELKLSSDNKTALLAGINSLKTAIKKEGKIFQKLLFYMMMVVLKTLTLPPRLCFVTLYKYHLCKNYSLS